METIEKRSAIVKVALSFTEGTSIAPCSYEKHLLEEYIEGRLSIDEVIALVEDSSSSNGH